MKKRNVKKITLINIISNIILQIANIFSWFIIPKIILTYFGSDVNGLVSSITQFLSYITLIEGGVTGVVMASLYKPLVNNDNKKISAIIKTSQKFYKKVGIIFSNIFSSFTIFKRDLNSMFLSNDNLHICAVKKV